MFYRFKTGQGRLGFPLALGLYHALKDRDLLDVDAVVPVPLSPDKASAGELHRTLKLAKELSRLAGVPVSECLSLSGPISKRRFMRSGKTQLDFERAYSGLLACKNPPSGRILLVDDVSTHGSTLRCCARVLQASTTCEIIAITAGLMITTHALAKPAEVLRP